MINFILFFVIIVVAGYDFIFSKFKKESSNQILVFENNTYSKKSKKNNLKRSLIFLLFISLLLFIGIFLDKTIELEFLISEVILLFSALIVYTVFSINAVKKYKTKKIIAREILYFAFNILLAVILFFANMIIFNYCNDKRIAINEVIQKSSISNGIAINNSNLDSKQLMHLGFIAKNENCKVFKFNDLINISYNESNSIKIYPNDLEKYKNNLTDSKLNLLNENFNFIADNYSFTKFKIYNITRETKISDFKDKELVDKFEKKLNDSFNKREKHRKEVMDKMRKLYPEAIVDENDNCIKNCDWFEKMKELNYYYLYDLWIIDDDTFEGRFGRLGDRTISSAYYRLNENHSLLRSNYNDVKITETFINIDVIDENIKISNDYIFNKTAKYGNIKKDCELIECYNEEILKTYEISPKFNLENYPTIIYEKDYKNYPNIDFNLYQSNKITTLQTDIKNNIINTELRNLKKSFFGNSSYDFGFNFNDESWLFAVFCLAYVYRLFITTLVLIIFSLKWSFKSYFE